MINSSTILPLRSFQFYVNEIQCLRTMSYLKTPKVSTFSHVLKVTCEKTKATCKEAANVNHTNRYGKKAFLRNERSQIT